MGIFLFGDSKMNISLKFSLVKSLKTSLETLAKLAHDSTYNIRYYVANNPNTPTRILDRLAHDEHVDVRWGVARNSNTLSTTLTHLAHDENEYVRQEVCENTNTSLKVLYELSEVFPHYYDIVTNPKAPEDLILQCRAQILRDRLFK
jgi:hypothetical protein